MEVYMTLGFRVLTISYDHIEVIYAVSSNQWNQTVVSDGLGF